MVSCMPTITLRVSQKQKDWFKDQASKQDVSVSEVLRRSFRDEVDKPVHDLDEFEERLQRLESFKSTVEGQMYR